MATIKKGLRYLSVYTEEHGAAWTRNKDNAWHFDKKSQIAARIAKKVGGKVATFRRRGSTPGGTAG